MIRGCLRWIFLALPVAAILVAIGAFALDLLGAQGAGARLFPSAIGWLVWQTVAPIVLWTGLTHWLPALKSHLFLEALLFPLVVAATGWLGILAVASPPWPSLTDLGGIAIVGWLGFSWALLAARWAAER